MAKRIGSDMNTMFGAELVKTPWNNPDGISDVQLELSFSGAINADNIVKFCMWCPTSRDLDKMIEELISVRNDLIVYENRLKK